MKKLLFVALAALLLLPVKAQQTKLLTAEKHNEYGIVYSLPNTAFQVEVVAVKETRIAGPFSNYSKIFTSDKNVISKDQTVWNIESVRVTPYGIADSEERYTMQLKAGATSYICVSDDGMLLAINKEVNLPSVSPLEVTQIEGETATGKEYLEFVNEDFISAQSSYKQAQLLAEELMEIRDARLSLTRGTADAMPTDGRQLEIMLASLEKQEKALTRAFTGSSWKERVIRTFTFVPEESGRKILCRLNNTEGLGPAENFSGEPIYISVNNVSEAQLPVDAKGEVKKIPKDAVVYCIPGTADISIQFKGNTLFNKNFELGQFGMNYGINPSLFTDKKEPSFAVFNPATGALLELGTIK